MRAIITLSCLFLCLAGSVLAAEMVKSGPAVQPSAPEWAGETTGNLIWHIQTPGYAATVSGIVVVEGWALSEVGISRIDLFVDGDYVSTANINIPRDDVIEHYPQYSDTPSNRPGFTVGFVGGDYVDGTHYLHLVVTDSNDHAETIGQRSVIVDNTVNPAPRGYLDAPLPDDTVHGPFPVYGWAIDENGIDRIEVMVDGLVASGAEYGGPRQDIYHAFPMFPNSALSGFIIYLDSNRIENGEHNITVRAYDTLGQSRDIGSRNVVFSNQPVNSPPFGFIEWPLRDVNMEGQCDDFCGGPSGDPTCFHPIHFIKGWALDTASRSDQGGVAWVELLVDGAIFFNTRRDCHYDTELESYVNCYGLTRWDVQQYYPGYTNSPEAGWKFWLDVGYLISNMGYTEGTHYISVRAGDVEDTVTTFDTIPVVFECLWAGNASGNPYPSQGYIDVPYAYENLQGTVRITGWAIDYNRIDHINVYVDGHFIGLATYPYERLDVKAEIDSSNYGRYSGWYFDLDTTQFTDGEHDLVIETVDKLVPADLRILGERRFVSDNNPSNP